MKFNLNKWQALKEKRTDLYRKLHAIGDDRDFVKINFTRQESNFLNAYDVRRDQPLKKQIIIDRKITHKAIQARLELIKNNWLAVCGEFSLTPDTTAKHSLINLYGNMVKLKNIEETYKKVSDEINDFMECWNTLEEFASNHIKISQPKLTAIA